jgi:hypothetical protein
MTKKKAHNNPPSQSPSSTKGKLVEAITAKLHEWPNVTVSRNIRLPVPGSRRRIAEIDVLLESDVAGYPVRMAIECKNEKIRIATKHINEFVGKLDDLGIPRQHGIYVSASGYTKAAIDRAQKSGIKLLKLEGLTKDRLSAAVVEAFQSIVYLLEVIREITLTSNAEEQMTDIEFHTLYNSEGQWCGMPADLIWERWYYDGEPASSLGEHQMQFHVQGGWHHIVDGQKVPLLSMTAKVHVVGCVVTLPGKAEHLSLVDASTWALERTMINLSFDESSPEYPVTIFKTEDELRTYMEKAYTVNVSIGRLRLPRIHAGPCYWPPSEHTAEKLRILITAFLEGSIPDPRPIDIRMLEGTNMRTMWEPMVQGWPSVERNSKRTPWHERQYAQSE